MPFVFNDPLHWLIQASEAREIAAQMTDLGARADMLTIAEEYDRIAQRAAERLDTIQMARLCEQTGVTIKLSTTRPSHDLPRLCGQAPSASRFWRRRASRTERAAMPTRYTVWVKNGQLGEKRVVVCDAPDVSAAIQQALEQAARNWECGTDILSVYGIAEGDVNGGLQ
jgi:hypothetical protein